VTNNPEKPGLCETVKQDGARCQARTLSGKPHCFFHDPASAEERTAASSRGGAKKNLPMPSQDAIDIALNSRSDAAALLARIINQLVRGAIDPKIANGAGFLIGIWLRATETIGGDCRIEHSASSVTRGPTPIQSMRGFER
jgi:hypothetical protein